MIRKVSKDEIRRQVHSRIRKKLRGTTERPRLAIFRSVSHIYAQVIDDQKGVTLVSANSNEKSGGEGKKSSRGGNLAAAQEIGKRIAERSKERGISKVVFDRGGYLYHGRVKALADAARQAGLEF